MSSTKATCTGNFSKYKLARNSKFKFMHGKKAYFGNLNPKKLKMFWKAVKYLNEGQRSIPTLSHHVCKLTLEKQNYSHYNEQPVTLLRAVVLVSFSEHTLHGHYSLLHFSWFRGGSEGPDDPDRNQ